MHRFKVLAIASLVAATLFAGAGILSAQTTAPPGDVKRGQQLFNDDGCYLCHNYYGRASGNRRPSNPGPNLAPAPIPYAAFARQVRTPRASMPPYDAKILTDQGVADIYAFLAAQPPAKDAKSFALLNVVSAGTATNTPHGAVIYAVNCSACHGASGQGGIGPALKNESSRKDSGAVATFVKNPPPPMPKLFPGLLTDADVAAVSGYVESLK